MRQLNKRLDRLETQIHRRRCGRLILHYVGEPMPMELDALDLVLTLHQPWCTRPEHNDRCREAAPQGGH